MAKAKIGFPEKTKVDSTNRVREQKACDKSNKSRNESARLTGYDVKDIESLESDGEPEVIK